MKKGSCIKNRVRNVLPVCLFIFFHHVLIIGNAYCNIHSQHPDSERQIVTTNSCIGDTVHFRLDNENQVLSVTWNFGDGTTSHALRPVKKYDAPGIYPVRADVRLINENILLETDVRIFTNPELYPKFGDTITICDGNTLVLKSEREFQGYLWSDGTTLSKTEVDSEGVYWLEVTDINGCKNADSVYVNVIEKPELNLGPDTTICSGESLLLDAGDGLVSYHWQDGKKTRKYAVTASGTYQVEIRAITGCSNTDAISVSVSELPLISLPDSVKICHGQDTTLDAGHHTSYIWDNKSDGRYYTTSVNGYHTLQVTNQYGCTSSDSLYLDVIELPFVDLGKDTSLCRGDYVFLGDHENNSQYIWQDQSMATQYKVMSPGTYHATMTNNCGSYTDTVNIEYYPGDTLNAGPDTSICPKETITLAVNQRFSRPVWQNVDTAYFFQPNDSGLVTVEAIDQYGCPKKDSVKISFKPTPVIDLAGDTTACSGDTMLLEIRNSTDTIHWSTGSENNTTEVYHSGLYTVEVTNDSGCQTKDSVYVHFYPVPETTLGPDTTVCPGDTITLGRQGYEHDYYSWSTGDTTATTRINQEGTYILTITNQYNCTARDSIYMSVSKPFPLFPFRDTIICAGDSYFFNPDYILNDIHWNDSYTKLKRRFNSPGTYILSGKDEYGCFMQDSLNLQTYPFPKIDIPGDTFLCDNETLVIESPKSGKLFINPDSLISDKFFIIDTGRYEFTLINDFDCRKEITMLVDTVYSVPHIDLGQDTTICLGSNLMLGQNIDVEKILWNTGEQVSPLTIHEPGLFSVDVSNRFCHDSDSIFVSVIEPPADFDQPDTTICLGSGLSFPLMTDFDSLKVFDDRETEIIDDVITSEGLYHAHFYYQACVFQSSFYVSTKDCSPDLTFPNIFTPNGDNKNSFFRIRDTENVKSLDIKIITRWGKQVYSFTKPTDKWNGTIQKTNHSAPDGIYYYFGDITGKDGIIYHINGFVYLIR